MLLTEGLIQKARSHTVNSNNHRRQFFVDSANSKGAELFCEVWLNLIILFQSEIAKFCPQIQMKTKKRSSPHSGSISVLIFKLHIYLKCQVGITCQKTERPNIFSPFSIRPEGVLPLASPQMMPMATSDKAR